MVDIIAGDRVHLQRGMHAYILLVGEESSRYNWVKEELGPLTGILEVHTKGGGI